MCFSSQYITIGCVRSRISFDQKSRCFHSFEHKGTPSVSDVYIFFNLVPFDLW
uniref:Uncharacterized protein n=1 Tax=Setaria italica TaxID=4555 RepID=K3YBX5_SETIT